MRFEFIRYFSLISDTISIAFLQQIAWELSIFRIIVTMVFYKSCLVLFTQKQAKKYPLLSASLWRIESQTSLLLRCRDSFEVLYKYNIFNDNTSLLYEHYSNGEVEFYS